MSTTNYWDEPGAYDDEERLEIWLAEAAFEKTNMILPVKVVCICCEDPSGYVRLDCELSTRDGEDLGVPIALWVSKEVAEQMAELASDDEWCRTLEDPIYTTIPMEILFLETHEGLDMAFWMAREQGTHVDPYIEWGN